MCKSQNVCPHVDTCELWFGTAQLNAVKCYTVVRPKSRERERAGPVDKWWKCQCGILGI